ncbi:MAG TPA: DinB family protein [Gemmatimonadaceae bacterium]|nr:DinB family protein [Gemmatimonadaceae bacterium]
MIQRSPRIPPSLATPVHPRTTELLRHLDQQHERLRNAVESIPRDQREKKPSPDRWSVAEVIEHLSIVETRIGRVFDAKLAEARNAGAVRAERDSTPVVGSIDMDRVLDRSRRITAAEASLPSGKLDAEGAWSALERARTALRDSVRAADGVALGEIVQPHPVLGPINLYQWIAFVGGHEARHAAQVMELRELLSEASTTDRH